MFCTQLLDLDGYALLLFLSRQPCQLPQSFRLLFALFFFLLRQSLIRLLVPRVSFNPQLRIILRVARLLLADNQAKAVFGLDTTGGAARVNLDEDQCQRRLCYRQLACGTNGILILARVSLFWTIFSYVVYPYLALSCIGAEI